MPAASDSVGDRAEHVRGDQPAAAVDEERLRRPWLTPYGPTVTPLGSKTTG